MSKTILLAMLLFFCACASPRSAINPNYDFESVKSIKIDSFGGSGGAAVQGSFMRQLLAKGYSIKTSNDKNVDAIIEGSVTTFIPDKKYLIRTPDDRSHNTVVYSDMVEISGSNMYDLGSAFGLGENNKIMASNATVGINAYMKDAKTGDIVWSDSYTYEGLDLSSALDGAVKYILRSLPKINQKGK